MFHPWTVYKMHICCQLILSTRVTSYSTLDKDFIAAQLLKDNYTDKLDADWAAAKHGYFHSSLRFTFRIALVTYIHHHNTIITKHIATQYLSTDNIIRQRKHLRSKLFHTETRFKYDRNRICIRKIKIELKPNFSLLLFLLRKSIVLYYFGYQVLHKYQIWFCFHKTITNRTRKVLWVWFIRERGLWGYT